MLETCPIFASYVEVFAAYEPLKVRVQTVLFALPEEVVRDFLDDPRFTMALDEFTPGKGRRVWMASPDPDGRESRSVVLKPRLADCSPEFAHYIIAHELAHAYLRNGGWGEISDREEAADALAASWGFSRPIY